MADEETLRARLLEAEDALHNIVTSQSVVEVDFQGHKTQFNRSNEGTLRRYIRDLKTELGEDCGSRRRRVVY
jgi:gpW protein